MTGKYLHMPMHHHTNIDAKVFCIIAFIKNTGLAAFATIFPLVLTGMLDTAGHVSIYYTVIAIIGLIVSLGSNIIFRNFSKIAVTKAMLGITVIILLAMTIAKTFWQIGGLDIIRAIAIFLINIALFLFVRDYTNTKNLGATQGKFYRYGNIGRLVGPFIGGYLAKYFGNQSIFLFASICFCIVLMIFLQQQFIKKNAHITQQKKEEKNTENTQKRIQTYFSDRQRTKAFFITFGLNFRRAMSYIYIPLHMYKLGFAEDSIGRVMGLFVVPLLAMETRVGRKATSKGAMKKFIKRGFTILGICTIAFGFLQNFPRILFIGFIAVNIGAARIEPLQETYFFSVTTPEEGEKFFGIYNAGKFIPNILGPLAGTAALFCSNESMSYVRIVTGIILMVFAGMSWKMKA